MTDGRALKSLFKFKASDNHLEELLVEAKLYFANRQELNDPNEAIIRFDRQKTLPEAEFEANPMVPFEIVPIEPQYAGVDNICFFCMSKVNDDVLMWSHYADNHRGLCLEFDFSEAIPQYLDGRDQPWKIEGLPRLP